MYKIFLIVLTSSILLKIQAQIADKEKDLRKISIDSTLIGWKKGGLFNLTFSQLSLTHWSSGGENSIAGNALLNLFAKYNKHRFSFESSLDLGYGILKQATAKSKKADDKIDFSSKFGYLICNNSFIAALINFKTQFMPGYNYPNDSVKISNFMAPAYLLFASGYDFKKKDVFSCFIAPITGKITFVNDQHLANAGSFGVEPAQFDTNGNVIKKGKQIRYEFGGYIKTSLQTKITNNINITSKLELFSNYFKNPENIDVYWETLLGMKISKYLAVSINTVLIYDDDIMIIIKDKSGNITGQGPRIQFKEVIGIGFSYKF
ncbi:MAG: DUF3078 domain-containing protein [Bacteroidales bacterium]|nr:DUF3078 domain-containing protein [Bacteroidales bacterium]